MLSTQTLQPLVFNLKELEKLLNQFDSNQSLLEQLPTTKSMLQGENIIVLNKQAYYEKTTMELRALSQQLKEAFLIEMQQNPKYNSTWLLSALKNLILLDFILDDYSNILPFIIRVRDNILNTPFSLTCMEKDAFDRLITNSKEPLIKPHLVKDKDSKYYLYGFIDKNWQLSPIQIESEDSLSFKNTATNLQLSLDHPLYHLVKKHHQLTMMNDKNLFAVTQLLRFIMESIANRNTHITSANKKSEEEIARARMLQSFIYACQDQLFEFYAPLHRDDTIPFLKSSLQELLSLNNPLKNDFIGEVQKWGDRIRAVYKDNISILDSCLLLLITVTGSPQQLQQALVSCQKVQSYIKQAIKPAQPEYALLIAIHEKIQNYFHDISTSNEVILNMDANTKNLLLEQFAAYISFYKIVFEDTNHKHVQPEIIQAILNLTNDLDKKMEALYSPTHPVWTAVENIICSMILQSTKVPKFDALENLIDRLIEIHAKIEPSKKMLLNDRISRMFSSCISGLWVLEKDSATKKEKINTGTIHVNLTAYYLLKHISKFGRHLTEERTALETKTYNYYYLYATYFTHKFTALIAQTAIDKNNNDVEYLRVYYELKNNNTLRDFPFEIFKKNHLHSSFNVNNFEDHYNKVKKSQRVLQEFPNLKTPFPHSMMDEMNKDLVNKPLEAYERFFNCIIEGLNFTAEIYKSHHALFSAVDYYSNHMTVYFVRMIDTLGDLDKDYGLRKMEGDQAVTNLVKKYSFMIYERLQSHEVYKIISKESELELYCLYSLLAKHDHQRSLDHLLQATAYFEKLARNPLTKGELSLSIRDHFIGNVTLLMKESITKIENSSTEDIASYKLITEQLTQLYQAIKKDEVKEQAQSNYYTITTVLSEVKERCVTSMAELEQLFPTLKKAMQDRIALDKAEKQQKINDEKKVREEKNKILKQMALEKKQLEEKERLKQTQSASVVEEKVQGEVSDVVAGPSTSAKKQTQAYKKPVPRRGKDKDKDKNKKKVTEHKKANEPADSERDIPIETMTDEQVIEVVHPIPEPRVDIVQEQPIIVEQGFVDMKVATGRIYTKDTIGEIVINKTAPYKKRVANIITPTIITPAILDVMFPNDNLAYFYELASKFDLVGVGSSLTQLLYQTLQDELKLTDIPLKVSDVDFYIPYAKGKTDAAIKYFSDPANGWKIDVANDYHINYSRTLNGMKYEITLQRERYTPSRKLMRLSSLEMRFVDFNQIQKKNDMQFHYVATSKHYGLEIYDQDNQCYSCIKEGVIEFDQLNLENTEALKDIRALYVRIIKEITLGTEKINFKMKPDSTLRGRDQYPLGKNLHEMLGYQWALQYFTLQTTNNGLHEMAALIKQDFLQNYLLKDVVKAFLYNQLLDKFALHHIQWQSDYIEFTLTKLCAKFLVRFTADQCKQGDCSASTIIFDMNKFIDNFFMQNILQQTESYPSQTVYHPQPLMMPYHPPYASHQSMYYPPFLEPQPQLVPPQMSLSSMGLFAQAPHVPLAPFNQVRIGVETRGQARDGARTRTQRAAQPKPAQKPIAAQSSSVNRAFFAEQKAEAPQPQAPEPQARPLAMIEDKVMISSPKSNVGATRK